MSGHSIYQITLAVIALSVFAALLSIVYYSWRNGITPMPSSLPARRAVVAELNRLTEASSVLEAGSGWGTLALHLARNSRAERIVGIENSWFPFIISRLLVRLSARHSKRIKMVRGNIYEAAYEGYDVIVCYLYPGAMTRLAPILQEHAAPGTRIISVCFALPGWQAERIVTCNDMYRTKIYHYIVA